MVLIGFLSEYHDSYKNCCIRACDNKILHSNTTHSLEFLIVDLSSVGVLKRGENVPPPKTLAEHDIVVVHLKHGKEGRPVETKPVFGVVKRVNKCYSTRNKQIHPILSHLCKYSFLDWKCLRGGIRLIVVPGICNQLEYLALCSGFWLVSFIRIGVSETQ